MQSLSLSFYYYREEFKIYYKNEAPYRCLDFLHAYFPRTQPLCQSIFRYFKRKRIKLKVLTEEELREKKWNRIDQFIQKTKNKIGIQDKILIAKSLDEYSDFALTENIIAVNEKKAFKYPLKAQEFGIAHELVHYHYRHSEKRILLGIVWVVIDLTCIILAYLKFSPLFLLALGVAEIAAFHFDKAFSRKQEKEG